MSCESSELYHQQGGLFSSRVAQVRSSDWSQVVADTRTSKLTDATTAVESGCQQNNYVYNSFCRKKKKRRISSQQAGGANYRQKRSGSVLVGNTDLNVAVTTFKFIHVAEEGKKN